MYQVAKDHPVVDSVVPMSDQFQYVIDSHYVCSLTTNHMGHSDKKLIFSRALLGEN